MAKREMPEAVKRKISRAQKGKSNSMYGRRHTKEALRKITAASRGENNPMHGRRHSPEAVEKIRQAALRRWRRAKTK